MEKKSKTIVIIDLYQDNQKGFTLIELVLVMILVSMLTAVSLPQMLFVTAQANDKAMAGVVGAVRVGISNIIATDLATGGLGTPPQGASALDSEPTGTTATDATPLFTTIVRNGIIDSHWSKSNTNTNVYVYTDNANNSSQWGYDPNSGSFTLYVP